jgi:hypothetical protein
VPLRFPSPIPSIGADHAQADAGNSTIHAAVTTTNRGTLQPIGDLLYTSAGLPRRNANTPENGVQTRRSADEQAPTEHALERLAVAVALHAPARQREVAAGLEVQVDSVAVGAQALTIR